MNATQRERLPNRRRGENIEFWHNGVKHTAMLGVYHDGRPGEVFIEAGKSGVDVNIAMKEAAIAVPRARPPSPRIASGWPSIMVGTASGVPGMLISTAEIAPPNTLPV